MSDVFVKVIRSMDEAYLAWLQSMKSKREGTSRPSGRRRKGRR